MNLMRASLLSRPRNVAERYPCPDPDKPRVVWAIPGYDLQCSVAHPKAWRRPVVPPRPKLLLGDGYRCRKDLDAAQMIREGRSLTGLGFPSVSRPRALCLKRRPKR